MYSHELSNVRKAKFNAHVFARRGDGNSVHGYVTHAVEYSQIVNYAAER